MNGAQTVSHAQIVRDAQAARRPVLIGGPTASGKSALALAIAERDSGVVINADALQVYARWQVLTARPGPDELARMPHALYGHVAGSRYSVGDWLRDAAVALAEARRAGMRPVFVGGTGLYLTALTDGLSPIPAVPAEVRDRADRAVADGRIGMLGDELARKDPETWAVIDRRNPARVQRAWEVLEATGRGLAAWRKIKEPPLIRRQDAVAIIMSPAPEVLDRQIAARFRAMIERGALAEARAALETGWEPKSPASRAIGAAELIAHLEGKMSLEAAAEAAALATRRFAKRQRTWFRNRMADWAWHAPEPGAAAALLPLVPRE